MAEAADAPLLPTEHKESELNAVSETNEDRRETNLSQYLSPMQEEQQEGSRRNTLLSPLSKIQADTDYTASPTRWYILAVFSLFSFNQCLVWFTFSSIKAPKVYEYYSGNSTASSHIDDSTVALLLNWGPIVGCLFFPFQVYMLTLSKGFRKATMLGAALVFSGAVIRFIPSLASAEWRHTSSLAILCLHVGQAIIHNTALPGRPSLSQRCCLIPGTNP